MVVPCTMTRREEILTMLCPSLYCSIATRPENHKALILEGLRQHMSLFKGHSKTHLHPVTLAQGEKHRWAGSRVSIS